MNCRVLSQQLEFTVDTKFGYMCLWEESTIQSVSRFKKQVSETFSKIHFYFIVKLSLEQWEKEEDIF